MSFTNRKQKYVEEKMTAKLKHKQTSIPTGWYHLLPVASLLTPLNFSLPTTFKFEILYKKNPVNPYSYLYPSLSIPTV
jgi:hypothetical protein